MALNQNRRKNKERRGDLFFSKQDCFERRRNPDRRCDGFEISTIFLSDDAFLRAWSRKCNFKDGNHHCGTCKLRAGFR